MISEIVKVLDFEEGSKHVIEGHPHFGFHDVEGNRYVLNYDEHWIGKLENNEIVFTIGKKPKVIDVEHYDVDITNPKFLDGHEKGKILFNGNKKVYRFNVKTKEVELVIDGFKCGFEEIGNCVYDKHMSIWINEIRACKVYHFDYNGQHVEVLGDDVGFNMGTVNFTEARFNWMYDLRRDTEGNIYVLDSKNYAIRKIDVDRKLVSTIAGIGIGGYSGDNDDAKICRFGSNESTTFDGPWAMTFDEFDNIYVGDTQNHVVRVICKKTNLIQTLQVLNGSKKECIQVPLICSMDYRDGLLFVPDYNGKLYIVKVN